MVGPWTCAAAVLAHICQLTAAVRPLTVDFRNTSERVLQQAGESLDEFFAATAAHEHVEIHKQPLEFNPGVCGKRPRAGEWKEISARYIRRREVQSSFRARQAWVPGE